MRKGRILPPKQRKEKIKKMKSYEKNKEQKKCIWKKLLQRFFRRKKRQESIEEITVKNLCSVQDIKSTLKEIIRSGENFVKYWKFHRPKEPHDINDISDVNINDILVSSKYHVGKKEL